jgi:hypothetical protein
MVVTVELGVENWHPKRKGGRNKLQECKYAVYLSLTVITYPNLTESDKR